VGYDLVKNGLECIQYGIVAVTIGSARTLPWLSISERLKDRCLERVSNFQGFTFKS
jgi:hypothetical protein